MTLRIGEVFGGIVREVVGSVGGDIASNAVASVWQRVDSRSDGWRWLHTVSGWRVHVQVCVWTRALKYQHVGFSHRQLVPGQDAADTDARLTADVLVAFELLRLDYPVRALYRAWRSIPPG